MFYHQSHTTVTVIFIYFILQYGTNPLIHEYNSIIIIVLIVYGNMAQYQRENEGSVLAMRIRRMIGELR